MHPARLEACIYQKAADCLSFHNRAGMESRAPPNKKFRSLESVWKMVCAKGSFGFASPGAMAFGKGNKSSSPSDNYDNGTDIQGEASQLSHGPSKMTWAPHTPGFVASLQPGQQISNPKMDEMTLRMQDIAPL